MEAGSTSNMSMSNDFIESAMECKSQPIYDKWWKRYQDFKHERLYNNNELCVFMDFMKFLASTLKVSSIWQAASCINKYLLLKFNIKHIDNQVFKSYMKHLGKSYVAKKSDALSMNDIEKYLRESSKTNSNLSVKVCMIIGVYGGLRISELTFLNFEDVKKDGSKYKVIVRESKTDQAGAGFEFLITPSPVEDVCPCRHITAYLNLFTVQEGRLFKKIGKTDRPTGQVMGVNTLAQYPKLVATFLGIEGMLLIHFHSKLMFLIPNY